MPEIKNAFTEGKMNKDLDERLVPNGHYIHAVNVEVTTSEDSDVGTVQNIYGNLGMSGNEHVPTNSVCVGTVADESNDNLYWLTATDKISVMQNRASINPDAPFKTFNAIFQYNVNNTNSGTPIDPVLVDIHQIAIAQEDFQNYQSTVNTINNKRLIICNYPIDINIGMQVVFHNTSSQVSYPAGQVIGMEVGHPLAPNGTVIIMDIGHNVGLTGMYNVVEFKGHVTGWNTRTLITGINIIDDMLFWTDNENEPKKINITRSKEGTFQYGTPSQAIHTNLISNNENKGPIREEHITVIRKRPLTPIVLGMKGDEIINSGIRGECTWNGKFSMSNTGRRPRAGDQINWTLSNNVASLDSASFNGTNRFDLEEGDNIVIKYQSDSIATGADFPIIDYDIRAKVILIDNNTWGGGPTIIRFEILHLKTENYPLSASNGMVWTFQKEIKREGLFELKFPRFSYRWKFEDSEYSSFAPWSNVAFLSGDFQYQTKEGFNLGMVNQLRELTLFDFVTMDMPDDVIQVDLLYKESDSPNVYIVDSLKKDDPIPFGGLKNPWLSEGSQSIDEQGLPSGYSLSNYSQLAKGAYKVQSDTIFASVAPNQLLRNWDAVPRRALAQEVIGNRLVYANYTRNFDLKPNNITKFVTNLTTAFNSFNVGEWQSKSVKTMREYQIGISYMDKYGRETPVFANKTSTVTIPKLFSEKSNILYSKINHLQPTNANSYKFYVKETSTGYHNLIMDRWYDAEDGDIWLSFNSHDRNKVDEETFLYLKRGHGGDIIDDEYKYKIISIKNEAPDFVRKIRKQYGIKPNDPVNDWGITTATTPSLPNNAIYHDGGTYNKMFFYNDGNPTVGKNEFHINAGVINDSSWSKVGDSEPWQDDHNIRIRFHRFADTAQNVMHRGSGNFFYKNDPQNTSDWYKITKVTLNHSNRQHLIQLDRELENDCLFVNPTGTITSNGAIASRICVEIADETHENLPEFDGRFFVKIINDATISSKIIQQESHTVVKSQPLYYFDQNDITGPTYDDGNANLTLYKEQAYGDIDYSQPVEPADDGDFQTVWAEWADAFGDGTSLTTATAASGATNQPKWFIDKLKYASSQHGAQWAPAGGVSFASWNLSDKIPGAGEGVNDANPGGPAIDISFCGITADNINAPGYWPHTQTNYTNSLNSLSKRFAFNEGSQFGSTAANSTHTWNSIPHNSETDLVKNYFKVGKQFRFSGDGAQTVYTIIGIETYNRWNYLDEDLWLNGNSDYSDITGSNDYALGYDGGTNAANDPTGGTTPNLIANIQDHVVTANNRRITFRLFLDKSIGSSGHDPTSGVTTNSTDTSIQFVERNISSITDRTSDKPAIWETEPKENADIDIFYEASQLYPMYLDLDNIANVFSIGSKVISDSNYAGVNFDPPLDELPEIIGFDALVPGRIHIKNVDATGNWNFTNGSYIKILDKNSANYIQLTATQVAAPFGGFVHLDVETNTHKWGRTLDWFNCFSFGNGAESNTIRDDFNQVIIDNGVQASTTVGWQYEEETLKSGLIFSGLYNAKTSLNDLNQFIEAENITKELNPSYGSIQKLHTRDSDLVALCEDKIIKILANKDALYNADENAQLIATNNVLGQAVPFIGDWGISDNPESFAKENFRSYFADRKRGAVLRLSRDGLTPISENGMKDWFRDNLLNNDRILGSYDTHKSHYNLTPISVGQTVCFNESSRGWSSFKTFVPENGVSMNNDYFTFDKGLLYKHHIGAINSFYNLPSEDSSIKFVFNEAPSVVKSFKTLNYEGTQSKVIPRDYDSEYTNLNSQNGWYVHNIKTDLQEGSVPDFVEKEGKWFNHIMGEIVLDNLTPLAIDERYDVIDGSEFSFQGIDVVANVPELITDTLHFGCTNADFEGYDAAANIDNGNCGVIAE
jgi:hypothetical protein